MNNCQALRILDGGSGFEATQMCKGHRDIAKHICWSSQLLFEDQSMVRNIYRNFLHSGAEVITSVSYQAHVSNFCSSYGLSISDAEQLIIDSVLLAQDEIRKIRQPTNGVLCAASIGPYGAHLGDGSEYNGKYVDIKSSFPEIKEFYKNQIDILSRANPDILAFETIPTIAELEMIIELMRQHPNTKAWISMSCADGNTTSHGEPLEAAVRCINKHSSDNIFAFGVNCVLPLLSVKDMIKKIRSQLDPSKIVIVYPNNGEVYDDEKGLWFFPDGVNENSFYEELPLWIKEGARWIGGCCRMGSDRMKRVGEIIRTYKE